MAFPQAALTSCGMTFLPGKSVKGELCPSMSPPCSLQVTLASSKPFERGRGTCSLAGSCTSSCLLCLAGTAPDVTSAAAHPHTTSLGVRDWPPTPFWSHLNHCPQHQDCARMSCCDPALGRVLLEGWELFKRKND